MSDEHALKRWMVVLKERSNVWYKAYCCHVIQGEIPEYILVTVSEVIIRTLSELYDSDYFYSTLN